MSNRYRHPTPGLGGALFAAFANHAGLPTLRRALLSRLPLPVLESDVVDVVYLTWWVDAATVAHWNPEGVPLWTRDGGTPFTVLTYAHGHLGPAALGPLRRLCPSPRQSNARLYTQNARRVLFVRNTLSSPLYTLGARLFSDVLPAHLATGFVHTRDGDTWRTEITPGDGSAPALSCVARRGEKTLPPEFAAHFADWDDAVAFLTEQDSALVPHETTGRLALATIDIPIDRNAIVPLAVESVRCPFATGTPFAFVVPRLRFRALTERLLPKGEPAPWE